MSEDTQAPQEETINGITEDMAFAAIFENAPMTIKFKVGPEGRERELELKVMWPDGDDESEIKARTAELLGVRPEFALASDLAFARGRAVIEQLAAPVFPEWLTGPGGQNLAKQTKMWHGKEMKRPDTGKLKSPAIPAMFYYAYSEVIARFHVLAAG